MAKNTNTELTEIAFERLRVELKQTVGFSLSVEVHLEIKEVIDYINDNLKEDK